jgi:hypothetical protein
VNKILDLLGLMPRPVQIAIAALLIGGIAVAAHEQRYMTVDQFTKSYVLDLKAEIRNTKKDLADPELDSRVREIFVEQLNAMLDELCYEMPEDAYCKARDLEDPD